jgi:hypothetical protein
MSISSSAVLVELNISVWTASKVDREVTNQVNATASAVYDASQTKKNLMAGTHLRKDIEKFASRVRLYHNQNTLPSLTANANNSSPNNNQAAIASNSSANTSLLMRSPLLLIRKI